MESQHSDDFSWDCCQHLSDSFRSKSQVCCYIRKELTEIQAGHLTLSKTFSLERSKDNPYACPANTSIFQDGPSTFLVWWCLGRILDHKFILEQTWRSSSPASCSKQIQIWWQLQFRDEDMLEAPLCTLHKVKILLHSQYRKPDFPVSQQQVALVALQFSEEAANTATSHQSDAFSEYKGTPG